MARSIIVMGVSGSGKSSIATLLAERLGLRLVEGDALHPKANIAKMEKGVPLTDDDRWPWLDAIGHEMAQAQTVGERIVVTCSALKRSYRERLRAAVGGELAFVYLEGSETLLAERMGHRTGHFMPASLLHSQLQTLESPQGEAGVITIGIDATIPAIVDAALRRLPEVA